MMIVKINLILIEKDSGLPDDMSIGDSVNISVDEFGGIVIGRASGVDVIVKAPSVGQRVVRLRLVNGGVMIDDLGSGGGSALEINGVRTQRPRDLSAPEGATLWIGKVGFRVELSSNQ